MQIITGLEKIKKEFPKVLENKRVGLVCHAASIDNNYNHIIDLFNNFPCTVTAIFGPQHGLFGQTQDNMIEWQGDEESKKESAVQLFSLYGKVRKPTDEMVEHLDVFVVDLQDVGARPYTYIWTIKNILEVSQEKGIPVVVLDRPNPVGKLPIDGAVLDPNYFTFVGGAEIPLNHKMTIGEMALFVKNEYFSSAELTVISMDGWYRNSLMSDFNLPWVLPSPNMPTLDTAIVYPGQVILETVNISEGRGTTTPFEMFGAPWLDRKQFREHFQKFDVEGVFLRDHDFIPTFNMYHGELCGGFQAHITNIEKFRPVEFTAAILKTAQECFPQDFTFNAPPYEYEYEKLPIDIVSGDTTLREWILNGSDLKEIRTVWSKKYDTFLEKFNRIALYRENR